MSIYDTTKIKNWYDDFTNCKSKYINNYYQVYKSSYIVSGADSSVIKIQRRLDEYYDKIKKGYSSIGNHWKSFYKDLINCDSVLAQEKSSGSINAASVASRLINMPELKDFKHESYSQYETLGSSTIGQGAIQDTISSYNSAASLNVSNNIEQASNENPNITQTIASGAIFGTIGTLIAGPVGGVAATGIATIASKTGVTSWIVDKASKAVDWIKNDGLEILKRACATVTTAVASLVEGLVKLVEIAVDLVALVGAAVSSVVTGVLDLGNWAASKITGDESYKSDYTKLLWEGTRSFVSKDYTGQAFDWFYENTPAGQWMKNNAYGFDTTRAIGKEIGEVIGVVALSTVTGPVGPALIYGTAKVTEHTETNWQDENTSTFGGLAKGVLQGTLDGVFFAIGAKGDAVAKAAAKTIAKEAIKTGSKETMKQATKEAGKILLKKMAFETGTAITQDLGTIGIDAMFSSNIVTDAQGNTIKLDNFGDKLNYYYQQAGGAKGLLTSAGTATILSALSDSSDILGQLKHKNVTAIKGAITDGGNNHTAKSITSGVDNAVPRLDGDVVKDADFYTYVVGDKKGRIVADVLNFKNRVKNSSSALKDKTQSKINGIKNKVQGKETVMYKGEEVEVKTVKFKDVDKTGKYTGKIANLKGKLKNTSDVIRDRIRVFKDKFLIHKTSKKIDDVVISRDFGDFEDSILDRRVDYFDNAGDPNVETIISKENIIENPKIDLEESQPKVSVETDSTIVKPTIDDVEAIEVEPDNVKIADYETFAAEHSSQPKYQWDKNNYDDLSESLSSFETTDDIYIAIEGSMHHKKPEINSDFISRHPDSPISKITDEQYEDISIYSGEAYSNINANIYSGYNDRATEFYKKIQKTIDDVLSKSFLSKNKVFYRGTSLEELGISSKSELYSLIGKNFTTKTNFSSSVSKNTAADFGDIIIRHPEEAGVNAIDMAGINMNREGEYLFGKGLQKKIVNVYEEVIDGKVKTIVEMVNIDVLKTAA